MKDLSDGALEEVLRERAFKLDAELWVAEREDHSHPWIAAFKKYNVEPLALTGEGVILRSVEAPTKREALEGLLHQDELG